IVISDSESTLLELSDTTPGMAESRFSIGVAIDDAMVSALAPLRLAVTTIVGKSTLGRELIGNCRYPTMPKIMIAAISSVVMTGRRMHSSGRFIGQPLTALRGGRWPPKITTISEKRAGVLSRLPPWAVAHLSGRRLRQF